MLGLIRANASQDSVKGPRLAMSTAKKRIVDAFARAQTYQLTARRVSVDLRRERGGAARALSQGIRHVQPAKACGALVRMQNHSVRR
jgi:hypothetical protein